MTDVRTEPLTGAGVVPVITIDYVDDAGWLAAALVQGGIPYAEITFRTPVAARAIDRMRAEAPQMTDETTRTDRLTRRRTLAAASGPGPTPPARG